MLPDCWLQYYIRFRKKLLALPADDLYRHVLFDSASTGIGFAKHMQHAGSASGSTLHLCILPCGGDGGLAAAPLDILQLRRLDIQLSHHAAVVSEEKKLNLPVTARTTGAAAGGCSPRPPHLHIQRIRHLQVLALVPAAMHSGWRASDTETASFPASIDQED